jgi:predicted permease
MKSIFRMCLGDRADEALADVHELHARRAAKGNRAMASLRLAFDVLSIVIVGLYERLISGIAADVRYAMRMLRKSPAFSAAAIVILALGIGANTAIFSLVNSILLTPIPSDHPSVVGIYSRSIEDGDYRSFSFADYEHIRDARAPFSDVFAHSVSRVGVTEGDDTRRATAVICTANYFAVLNVRLALGREFTRDEERPDSNIRVVIVSHSYWQRRNGTSDILGANLRVNGQDYTVVGVAPEGFTGTMALMSPDFFFPTGVYEHILDDLFRQGSNARLTDPAMRGLMLVGRLPQGASVEAAAPLLDRLSARLVDIDSAENSKHRLVAQELPRLAISTNPANDTGPMMLSGLLMATASLVLLLACLNLANMLLARGTTRRREIAVRVAVGGGRLRIVRQLLIESLVLSLIGGAAGLLIAVVATDLFMSSARAAMPITLAIGGPPDYRVLTATLVFCVFSTVAAGLGPAWRASRSDLVLDLKDHPVVAAGLRRFSVRNALVVGQLAVCLALLVSAGLFVRGAGQVATMDLGFNSGRSIVLGVDSGLVGYSEMQGRRTMNRLVEQLRAVPGVQSVSFGSQVPYGDEHDGRPVQRIDRAKDVDVFGSTYTIVGAHYFATLGVPVLRGREFSEAEEQSASAAPIAVIDQPLATRLFGDANPIGERIRFTRESDSDAVMEIVGVVGPVRDSVSDVTPEPHVYVPYGQRFMSGQYVHLRVQDGVSAEALLRPVRQVVTNVDPTLPVLRLKTFDDFRRNSLQVWVFGAGARIFSTFGVVALVLAVAGVYGLKAFVVSRRTREIAIRLALGATNRGVLLMIVREGLTLTLVGLTAGLAAAFGMGRVLSNFLYGVSATDPMVFGGAVATLGVAALVASYLPARRATKMPPATALRAD